jgi:oligopeptide/dipeptide ABC transporter ATP-binding protein
MLLEVRDLRTAFSTEDGVVHAVNGVSFSLERGKVVGIVGESGSGKSVTCLTLLGLTPRRRVTTTGEAMFNGKNLLRLTGADLRAIRGREMAMIFQDPLTSLNPVLTVGVQMLEMIQLHQSISRKAALSQIKQMISAVGIPDPESIIRRYPFELSGGMRQRIMIAMALSNNPDLLIADEPTTALDVTTQAQILDLIRRLRTKFNSAIILITHDLGVVAEVCDSVLVMYAGSIVEDGSVDMIFDAPSHPYTWGLLGSLPSARRGKGRLQMIPGSPPSLLRLPPGCPFQPRCAYALPVCSEVRPPLEPVEASPGHAAACHLSHEQRRAEAGRLAGIDYVGEAR